jgi:UDPglucose 6-dehydrogenase
VTEEAEGIKLTRVLLENGHKVVVYDPLALGEAKSIFGDQIQYAESSKSCVEQVDSLIITLPLDEFKLPQFEFRSGSQKNVIIDCWGILNKNHLSPQCEYYRIGAYNQLN